jgi:hypothetical protein
MQIKHWKCECGHIFPEYMSAMDSDGQERCPKCTRPVNGNPEIISADTYSVVHIEFHNISFNSNSGLFIIVGEVDGNYHISKLDDRGLPEFNDDGSLDVAVTSVDTGFKTITKTNLLFTLFN